MESARQEDEQADLQDDHANAQQPPAQPPLQPVHGAVVGLVVVAEHVQEAVERQHVELLGQRAPEAARVALGRLHADHDVAEAGFPAVARERQHVRRLVLAAVAGVEPAQQAVAGEHERHLARDAERPGGRAQHAGAGADGDHRRAPLAVQQHDLQRRGALMRSAPCPGRPVALVGLDDGLHEPVAHHVLLVEVAEGDALDCPRAPRSPPPGPRPCPRAGRSA